MQHENSTQEKGQSHAASAPDLDPKFEAVAQAWNGLDDGEALLLSDLTKDDVKRLRRLFYKRFGKINVLVRSVQQDDGTHKAVVRTREGKEYLWEKSK